MVQVDTWVAAAGKNGMRRDWHVHDYNSGRTILRATRYVFHLFFFFFYLSLALSLMIRKRNSLVMICLPFVFSLQCLGDDE